MRAAVYERISKDREGLKLGVERQHEDNLALLARKGYELYPGGNGPDGVYRDNDRGASTRSKKPRPDYQQLLADAQAGRVEVIVAYTTGRLTRRPREHEDLIDLATEYGIRYDFVASPSFDLNTSAGRRIARTLAAMDAGEAEDTAERVQREVEQKAKQGRYHGGPRAFGFGVVVGEDPLAGKVIIDNTKVREDEAAVVREWYQTIVAGGTIAGIRKAMTRRGILTPAGKQWHDSSIKVVLVNPRNAGLRILRGVEYPAPNPAIVPVETWRAVQQILADPGRKTNFEGAARKYIGAGLFVCERCQNTVSTSYDGVKGKSWRIYVCRRDRAGCGRSWKAEPIDEYIGALVEGIVSAEDAAERLLVRPAADGVDVEGLRTEAIAIRRNMKALAADAVLLKGESRAALLDGLREGETRLEQINAELAKAGRTNPLAPVLLADDPVAAYRDIEDLARRQAVIRAVCTVELGAPIRGRAKWDAAKFISAMPVT